MQDIITGIDVGSTQIRIVVGQRVPTSDSSEKEELRIIAAVAVPSEGINKGIVNSIDDAVSSISGCLEKAERMSGVPIERAFVGISGLHIISQLSKGVIAVSKANGEIKEEDIERVIEAAQAVATPPNYEIIHVIPKTFVVDTQKGIKDPVGMTGVRLEMDAQIVQGLSSQIKNLTKTIYRTGVDIDELVLSAIASGEGVLTNKQKELGVVVVNIGGSTTTLSVFEEGDVIYTSILPVGANHITSDIAIGLRTSVEVAEQIKISYGTALSNEVGEDEEIYLNEFDENDNSTYPRKHLSNIIEARLEEIYEIVDKELRSINRSGLLPAGVILTGGGVKIKGAVEVAKQKFRLPASIGKISFEQISSPIAKINDPAFSVALGLVVWGDQVKERKKTKISFSSVGDVKKRMKELFKSFIP